MLTYGQPEVKAFARALTGWTYAPYPRHASPRRGSDDSATTARRWWPSDAARHRAEELLRGIELPRRADARRGRPRRAPQRLPAPQRRAVHRAPADPPPGDRHAVAPRTSTASPPCSRTTAPAMRGNLKAVVRAILLDPEARTAPTTRMRATGASASPRCTSPRSCAAWARRATVSARRGHARRWARTCSTRRRCSTTSRPSTRSPAPTSSRRRWASTTPTPCSRAATSSTGCCAKAASTATKRSRRRSAPSSTLAPWIALAADPRKLLAASTTRFFGGAMPAGRARRDLRRAAQIDDAARARAHRDLPRATAFQFQVSR